MDKYKNFSLEDFLQDRYFRKWVEEPFSEDAKTWETWLKNNPEIRDVVEEARFVFLSSAQKTQELPGDFYLKLKKRVDQTIAASSKRRVFNLLGPARIKAAAVFAGLVIGAAILFYSLSGKEEVIKYGSNYGQTKNVILPDGSQVLLNANSFLEYKRNPHNKTREVWLKGEGFFYISHQDDEKEPVRFIVHSKDVIVEVLGTQFNVNSTDSAETRVLLTKGKVKFSVTGGDMQPVTLRPADLVSYDKTNRELSVKQVSVDNYLSWMNHKYTFEKTTLQDVGKVIHQYYGKPVILRNVKMGEERLSGTLELQDEATLVQTLSALLGVPVDNDNNQINIGSE